MPGVPRAASGGVGEGGTGSDGGAPGDKKKAKKMENTKKMRRHGEIIKKIQKNGEDNMQ